MGSFWIALVSALGASGVAGALVSWWKDRHKDDATVTKLIREMSKDAVSDAREDVTAMRAELREAVAVSREIRGLLREVVTLLENPVIVASVVEHPLTAAQLAQIAERARLLV